MDVVVQPSVPWMKLNDDIKDSGLFFPVDPGPSVSDPATPSTSAGIPHEANPDHDANKRGRQGLEAWLEPAAGDFSSFDRDVI
jgi:FAD/FMN-containing dehydrogenase